MTNGESNMDPKQECPRNSKFGKIIVLKSGWVAVAVAILFWFIESALHAFLFDDGSYYQQFFRPTVNEIWMRSLVMFLIITLGFCIQWSLKILEMRKFDQKDFPFSLKPFSAISDSAISKRSTKSLSKVIFMAMLSVSISCILMFGVYWVCDEWSEFNDQCSMIRADFLESQENTLKTEIDRAIDSITFWRSAIRSEYPDISEDLLKEKVFARLSQITFGPDNEYFIFVGDYDGTELVNRKSPHLIGKNFWEMEDAYGVKVFQEEIRIAKSRPEGGFLTYFWSETDSDADAEPKLSFVRGVPGLQLFVGAGANLNTVEDVIAAKESKERAHVEQGVVVLCVVVFLSLLIVFLIACWLTVRIRRSFDIFALFFKKASTESVNIDHSQMYYDEFLDLATSANQMIADRKIAEAALQESERRMREMLSNVQLCTVMLDKDGTITYVNDFLLKTTGYERDEILGGNWFDLFIPAELREEIRGVHKEVLCGKLEMVGQYESEMLTKSGERRSISWSNTLFLHSTKGDTIGSTSFGEDVTERKRAEEELREIDERFRLMMEQSPAVFEFYDIDGLQINVNKAYEELWGFPASHTVNKFNLLESKEVEETGLIDYIKKAYAGQAVTVPEYEFDPSGTTEAKGLGRKRWLSTRIYPLKGASGDVKNVVITHEDITERKQAEEEAKQSQNKYQSLVSNIPGIIYRCKLDKDWTMLYISNEVSQLTGYPVSDFINNAVRTYESIVHRDDTERTARITNEAIESGEPWELEYRICHKDGTIRWHYERGSAVIGESNKVEYLDGVILDITERKEAEEALKRLNQQNQLLLNTAGEGIYGLDLDGNTTFINPTAARMIGWEVEEIIGKNQHELLHHTKPDGSPYPAGVCPVYTTYKDGNTHHVDDEVFWRKDGSCFPVEYISTPIRDEHGVIEGAVVTFKDISDRKQSEEKQKQHHDELTHASRLSSMGQMASGLAHEINQPLCAIASFADAGLRMLKSKRFKSQDLLEAMQGVSTQSHRAGAIVKNLRSFVRKKSAEPSVVDICEVIKNTIILVQGQLNQKQAKIELDIPSEPLLIHANTVKIEQVVINLIQNALEAMEQIDPAEREILIKASSTDDEMIIVSVVDSGKGLDGIGPLQIFDPFFTTKEEGMGIGLSINESLIEEHNGKLWAEDNEKGATFNFTIPIAEKGNR
jgi:PAS domain S-box-containing protein